MHAHKQVLNTTERQLLHQPRQLPTNQQTANHFIFTGLPAHLRGALPLPTASVSHSAQRVRRTQVRLYDNTAQSAGVHGAIRSGRHGAVCGGLFVVRAVRGFAGMTEGGRDTPTRTSVIIFPLLIRTRPPNPSAPPSWAYDCGLSPHLAISRRGPSRKAGTRLLSDFADGISPFWITLDYIFSNLGFIGLGFSTRHQHEYPHHTAPSPLQHPPDTLPSPMSVLEWRAGDSFDLALVLASLLIGVGFNAFVVMGYAPYAVVQNDQRNTVCTVLEREVQGAAAAAVGAKVRQPHPCPDHILSYRTTVARQPECQLPLLPSKHTHDALPPTATNQPLQSISHLITALHRQVFSPHSLSTHIHLAIVKFRIHRISLCVSRLLLLLPSPPYSFI